MRKLLTLILLFSGLAHAQQNYNPYTPPGTTTNTFTNRFKQNTVDSLNDLWLGVNGKFFHVLTGVQSAATFIPQSDTTLMRQKTFAQTVSFDLNTFVHTGVFNIYFDNVYHPGWTNIPTGYTSMYGNMMVSISGSPSNNSENITQQLYVQTNLGFRSFWRMTVYRTSTGATNWAGIPWTTYLNNGDTFSVSANNGLTDSAGTVLQLGGGLNQNTSIALNGYYMNIGTGQNGYYVDDSGNETEFYSGNGLNYAYIDLQPGYIGLFNQMDAGTQSISLPGTGTPIQVVDQVNNAWMAYQVDYSANSLSNPRSIPDLGWVQGQLANKLDTTHTVTINGIVKKLNINPAFTISAGTGTLTSFSKTDNFGITSTVTNPTTTPTHIIAVDTTVIKSKASALADYNNLTTRINGKGSGTVTSIATGTGILGGTITGSGTIKADTSVLQTIANFFPKGDTRYLRLGGSNQAITQIPNFANGFTSAAGITATSVNVGGSGVFGQNLTASLGVYGQFFQTVTGLTTIGEDKAAGQTDIRNSSASGSTGFQLKTNGDIIAGTGLYGTQSGIKISGGKTYDLTTGTRYAELTDIPAAITLTTNNTSGVATLSGGVLNVPNYAATSYTFTNGLTIASGTVSNNYYTGVSGGQTIVGGTAATDGLIFKATTGNQTSGTAFTWNGGNNGGTNLMKLDYAGNITFASGATINDLYGTINTNTVYIQTLQSASTSSPLTAFQAYYNSAINIFNLLPGIRNGSGTNIILNLGGVYQQTGAAASTDLNITRNESGGVGTGSQYFANFIQTSTPRFNVTNTGIEYLSGALLSGSSTNDGINQLQITGSAAITATETSVNGSTSGTAKFSEPLQGTKLKHIVIQLIALNGTASYTFPSAFIYTPKVMSGNSSLVTSLSTTAITVTGSTTSDTIILEGY